MFHCNFNYTKLQISLPEFYKECIVAWTRLNEDNPSSLSEIANQVIWNNRFICIESKSIYNNRPVDLGIVKIRDLYDTRGDRKSNKEPLYSTLSTVKHFLLFILFNAFPQEWRKVLKTSKSSISSKTHDLIPTDFNLRIEEKIIIFKIFNRSHYMKVLFLRYLVHQQRRRNITKLSTRTHPNETGKTYTYRPLKQHWILN